MKFRLTILFEFSEVGLPFGGSFIRLLCPLTYPDAEERFYVYPLPIDDGNPTELVIVDRFWRPDLTLDIARRLKASVRNRGAKLLYQVDDDLLLLQERDLDPQLARRVDAATFLLEEADGVLTSNQRLADRFSPLNSRIHVIPNALDERLLAGTLLPRGLKPSFTDRPLTLGYMGTRTHDADLRLILPALKRVGNTVKRPLELQIIGGIEADSLRREIGELPIRVKEVSVPVEQYPLFMNWFTSGVDWDVALAPLADTPFNRGKSDLKFLDYAALGAAGIYSRMPVYSESVEHGVTGLLVENETEAWVEALLSLIEDAGMRRDMAANAHRYLHQTRTLAHRIQDWIDPLEVYLYA